MPDQHVHSELESLLTPIAELACYGRNPRQGDIAVIAESLEANGQYRPIVANRRTHEVLAGNHTLLAAQSLGWTHVATTWVDVDDETAARIVLVDNRANDLATYDDTVLAGLLNELPDLTGTGYDAAALAELLAGTETTLTDADAVPEPPAAQPISQPGDLWLLGPHRLVVGDGGDPGDVALALDGEPAALLVTDPPYNVDYTGKTRDALKIEGDAMDDAEFRAFLTRLFAAAAEHTRAGGGAYIFHSDTVGANFRDCFGVAGWDLKQVLVWVKNSMVLGRQDYHWQHEPILYGWKPGAAHAWYGGRTLTTLIDDQVDPERLSKAEAIRTLRELLEESTAIRADRPQANRDHPTIKPVALLAALISHSSRFDERILDVCAGSGSTLIAAHQTRRRAALVEIDPRYADVICRRYQEHTGTIPIRDRDGKAVDFTTAEQKRRMRR